MRWSIIRLIWVRELRDQLRDRRTIFMIAILPILLYPAAGFGLLQLAMSQIGKQTVLGVQGRQYLPPWTVRCTDLSPLPAVGWFTATPSGVGVPLAGVASAGGAIAFDQARRYDPTQDYPPLFVGEGEKHRFASVYLDNPMEGRIIVIRELDVPSRDARAFDPNALARDQRGQNDDYLARIDRSALDEKQVDLLLVVPPNFEEMLRKDGRPFIYLLARESDERSRGMEHRVTSILRRWKKQLKEVRMLRHGLPADFDEMFEVRDASRAWVPGKRASEDLIDQLVRIFPFILVMWSLAGALYPAVDLCAGEKERGTMETLLISPASREEIVWGKFLTIWVFSASTALLNLASMGLTAWQFGHILSANTTFRPAALFWAVALLLPLSAFFSAICLAIGAYARSTKEGQYYLMPLFLVTMPLIFLTLAPGVELNHFYSMVPVTGVALLLQKLIGVKPPESGLWAYFVPVLAPMVVYCWVALRWAIEQFQREEVLFREAERLELRLWLRRLFREKEALPSAGQAFFCFALILGLHWLSLGSGGRVSPVVSHAIRYLAFVATPPLFMVLLLTTRPFQGLALGWPPWWMWPVSIVLAVLLLPPFSALTLLLLDQFPHIKQALRESQEVLGQTARLSRLATGERSIVFFSFVFVILPSLCEELAFRGFIFGGLRQRFRPWTAVLLSSLLYALYQLNVLQALPHFLLGIVLAMLVQRGGSLVGAIVFRLVWESLLWSPLLSRGAFSISDWIDGGGAVAVCLLLAAPLLAMLRPNSTGREPTAGPPDSASCPERA